MSALVQTIALLHSATLYRQVLGQAEDAPRFDIGTLAQQHAQTLLQGLMLPDGAGHGKDRNA